MRYVSPTVVNSYTLLASPATIDCLASIVGVEADAFVSDDLAKIVTSAATVIITSEAVDLDTNFECCRIDAECAQTSTTAIRAIRLGRLTRIRLLESEEWIEPAVGEQPAGFIGRVQAWQSGGFPGSAPAEAIAKCAIHDGVLLTGTLAELLIACDPMPTLIQTSTQPDEIAEFANERRSLELQAR